MIDHLVVGAGFAGSVVAERLAASGKKVLVLESRSHVGGNAHDFLDAHGVLVHSYGPHIFHTNSEKVFEYLSRFTGWRSYEHRVKASVDGQLYPFPINRTTLSMLFGLQLSEEEAATFLARQRSAIRSVRTSEDVVLNSVGPYLCDQFFRKYTRKQWGLDLDELMPSVAGRIPVRTNEDDRYFTDQFQAMPLNGYTAMFKQMLDHPNIQVELGVTFDQRKHRAGHVFYTGKLDAYFDFCYGKLPYRSLSFEFEHFAGVSQHQPVGQINYPNDHDYTRVTEFKHLTGQWHSGTTIAREFPRADGDPYYPIPTGWNEALRSRYMELAAACRSTSFVGRLATYRYFNMDQVVAAALHLMEDFHG